MTTIPLEVELRDAWEGEGNSKRITFEEWIQEMADNDQGTLQDAAKDFLRLQQANPTFEHACDWLSWKINKLEAAGDTKTLAQMFRALTLDGDTIQDTFQEDMTKDGFFDDNENDIAEPTDEQRDAVTGAMGYEVDDDDIRNAVNAHKNKSNAELTTALVLKEKQFKAKGGRGVMLAEEIDELRIVKAVRSLDPDPCEA